MREHNWAVILLCVIFGLVTPVFLLIASEGTNVYGAILVLLVGWAVGIVVGCNVAVEGE